MFKDRRTVAGFGLVLAIVLFIAVNILSGVLFRNARIDFTQDGLYTLSDGSRKILSEINEPILLRFFFSQDLANNVPVIRDYGSRVRELLEQYVAASNGALALEVVDPEPFSDEEDDAVAYGLQGLPLSDLGGRLYFGLVATNTTDDEVVFGFFQQDRESFLEYDLTRMVYDLANPDKPVVGLVSSLPVNGGPPPQQAPQRGPSPPWAIMQQISPLFEIRDIGANPARIDEDIDVLLLIHPRNLTPESQFAIDQYVLAGGKLVVFVDPFSEASAANPDPENPMDTHNSNLQDLFTAWGFELSPGMIVGDLRAAQRVNTGSANQPRITPYIPWLELRAANMNRDEIVTSSLDRIQIKSSGRLIPNTDSGVTFTPLIWTSPESTEFERFHIQFRPDPDALIQDFKASGEAYTLAARVRGTVKTAFPEGPATDPEAPVDVTAEETENAEDAETVEAPTQLYESVEPINLVVVADTDMLADRSWVQVQNYFGQQLAVPFANNGAFLVNVVDVLAGGSDLIELRTRGTSIRPFGVVEEIQRNAEARFRETEQALQAKLRETETQLAQLQTNEAAGAPVLSQEQQQAIESFRSELVSTRKQLRDVQHELHKDIESLGVYLKFINIALVPIVIAIVAIALSLVRRARRRRASGMA